ncbi:MAG: hypothetical protein KAV83_04460 [Desulfobacterales bacterium]|nr:hypothetical protein [Desulfobacterales bacterium]
MLPVDIPEFNNYKNVCAFVRDHLSMQFGDVRSMMRLPLPGLGIVHACNFAAAATLCNLISGISVSLFIPANPVKARKGKRQWIGTGQTFKQLLENFYPWQPVERGTEGAKVLYDLFRNPFAHALGVHSKAHYQIQVTRISIMKKENEPATGLLDDQLEEIERSSTRPSWLARGLSGAGKQWNLLVEGFYRDVFHMLWNLAKDKNQMSEAEKRFSRGRIIWREGKP